MLYAHVADAKNAGSESDRSEYGELGLGAVVPHVANASISSGGGLTTQGTGGGIPAGSTPVAGTVGSTYKPAGRTTSPDAKGKAQAGSVGRNTFQASAQGSRVSMGKAAVPTALRGQAGSRSSGFPAGGLYGLDNDYDIPEDAGLSGIFGKIAKWGKRTVTPPGGWSKPRFDKIQLGAPVARVLPTPLRTAARYIGMASPVGLIQIGLSPASASRRIWGLSPTESKYVEMGAKAIRVTAAVVGTVGAAAYLMPAAAPAIGPGTTAIGGYAPAGAFTGAGGASVPFATVGGQGAAGAYSAAAWAPAALPSTVGIPSIGVITGVTASSPLGFSAAGVPVQAGSASWLATHPVTAGIGKAVGTTALSVAAQKILQGPGQAPSPTSYESGGVVVEGGGSQAQPQNLPIILGGGSGGGAPADSVATEALASTSLPMIVAGSAIVFVIGYKLLKRKS